MPAPLRTSPQLNVRLLARASFGVRVLSDRVVLVELRNEFPGCHRRNHPRGYDLAVVQWFAVELGVVVQILPESGSFQSNTGKQSLASRPREAFSMHLRVGLSCCRASNRATGN